MQVPKPTYLYVPEKYLPPSGKVESGSKITLRCVNGDFLEIPTTANASKVSQGCHFPNFSKYSALFIHSVAMFCYGCCC